jgi:hypothetical protein
MTSAGFSPATMRIVRAGALALTREGVALGEIVDGLQPFLAQLPSDDQLLNLPRDWRDRPAADFLVKKDSK